MKLLKVAFLWSSCFLMSMSVWASEGVLDTTFHSPDGYVLWDGGSGYDRGRDIALQQDGKILVTGYMTNGTDDDIMVICYNKDGTLDAGISEQCFDLIVQSDDTILIIGYSGDSIGGISDWSLVVLKYARNGTFDTTFGTNGIYRYNPTDKTEWGYGLALQSDGKIIVAGQVHNGTDDDVIVLRLTNSAGDSNEPNDSNDILSLLIWFRQEHLDQKYWFSVIAVYKAQLDEIQYPWGWTNRPHMFGSTAISITRDGFVPEPIYDQTGEPVDMSFTFSTVPH